MEALKNVFIKKQEEVCSILLFGFLAAEIYSKGEPALVTFVTAGYPSPAETVPIMLAMQEGGVDIIEIGVPFSDPIADGPAIQETNQVCTLEAVCVLTYLPSHLQVAIEHEVTYANCLEIVKEARSKGLTTPVLLMGASIYYFAARWRLTTYDVQDTTTLCSPTERKKPFRMPMTMVPMDSFSLTFLRKKLSRSGRSVRRPSKSVHT